MIRSIDEGAMFGYNDNKTNRIKKNRGMHEIGRTLLSSHFKSSW
jgi:hypothetical protein